MFSYDTLDGVPHVCISGAPDYEHLIEVLRLLTDQTDTSLGNGVIVDLTERAPPVPPFRDVQRYAAAVAPLVNRFGNRVALVIVPAALSFGVARQFASLLESGGARVGIFPRLEAAHRWIRRQPDWWAPHPPARGPVAFQVMDDPDVRVLRIRGNATYAMGREMVQAALAEIGPPRGLGTVIDYSGTDGPPISHDEMEELLGLLEASRDRMGRRVAFVVPTAPVEVGVARLLEARADLRGLELAAFLDGESATRWVVSGGRS